MPDQRPIDLPAALLLAAATLALSVAAGAAFLLVAVVAASGRDAVALDAAWTAACAGCATVALLLLLTRAAVRPAALAVAGVFGAAWPLLGVPAALLATLAIGMVVRWGARPAPLRHGMPLAATSATLALAFLTAAATAPSDPTAAANAASPRAAAEPTAGGDARPSRADEAAGSSRTDATTGGAESSRAAVRAVVLDYYDALDRRAFGRAWRSLSPGVHAGFGGFERWRAGFGQTLSSRPAALEVQRSGDVATVAHRLVARDRAACGVAVRHFTVRWELRRSPAGWQAVGLEGAPAAGTVPLCE